MSNVFYKPYMNSTEKVYFPYTREKLTEKPIFPAYVYDGGAFLFINDAFDAADSDKLLELIMSGELFDYWKFKGKFDWNTAFKKHMIAGMGFEPEAHYWLNRMYLLLPLAQKFCITKDKKYSYKWYELLFDWFENNPYDPEAPYRVWFDMQVAWRCINIVHSIFLFGNEDVFTKEQWKNIYELVKIHADHLYKESVVHIETKITGNHKLQIAVADIMVGCLFPEFENSKEYIEAGRMMVEENLRRAIKPDGVSHENAVSYAHFIARLYLEAELLLTFNGHTSVDGLTESIQKQYEYLYQYSSPKGITMQIGDSYAMDALADIDFVNSFYPLTFKREKKSVLFADSHLAVLRNSRFDLYIDAMQANPVGNGYTWHQHYGKPTFVLYIDGRPAVIDRGCPNYNKADLYIPLYIESGHNVISCNELPLSVGAYVKPTEVTYNTKITHFCDTEDVKQITIENEIAGSDTRKFVWSRTFELYTDRLEITDTVNASEKMHFTSYIYIPGFIEMRFPLPPVMPGQAMSCESGVLKIRYDETVQTVKTDTPFAFECRPYINEKNKVDYCDAIERSFYTDSFTERTVFTIEDFL